MTKICIQCGREYPDYIKNHKYCSQICANISGYRRKNKIQKICQWCGKNYDVKPSLADQKYCSHSCRQSSRIKEKSSRWKGGDIEKVCENCGNTYLVRRYKKNKARFCSFDCRVAYCRGEKSSSWRGGISFIEYPSEFNYKLKKSIRERDEYTCAICGKLGKIVHHIDYNKTNSDSLNLITLCQPCHSLTNGNRERWQAFFDDALKAIGVI
jgi:hypothetical protein